MRKSLAKIVVAAVGLVLLGAALAQAGVRHPDEWPPCGPPWNCSAVR